MLCTFFPISAGESTTFMPYSFNIFFLALAVSSEPPTIAPACPIVLPIGAVSPAINPTTGFLLLLSLYHLAASASNCPPISYHNYTFCL